MGVIVRCSRFCRLFNFERFSGRHAGALLLYHDRLTAPMAEALPDRRGLRALQRQSLAAGAALRPCVIRLAHSILSPTTSRKGAAGLRPYHSPHLLKNRPSSTT